MIFFRSVPSVPKSAVMCFLISLAIALTCCEIDEPGEPTIVSISVKPVDSRTNPDSTVQFTVNATYSDDVVEENWTPDGGFKWASSNTSVATIDQSGLATAVDVGNTTITATYPPDGSEFTGSTSLTVMLEATAIGISPSSVTVDAGASEQLSVIADYEDTSQGEVTAWVSWSSDDPTIATVSPSGVVTGISAGSTTVRANFDLLTDAISVTVNPPPENQDVAEAVALAQLTYVFGALIEYFGDPVEGFSFNETTGVMTFTSFDITELETSYTTVSGTVSFMPDDSLEFDLTFTGGPISSLYFTLDSEQIDTLENEESVSVDVTADGDEYTVTLEPAALD